MAKRRQNHRGDFSMIHIFQKDGEQIAVPQHIRIEYYTPFRKRRYVVERNGDSCKNCYIDGILLSPLLHYLTPTLVQAYYAIQ